MPRDTNDVGTAPSHDQPPSSESPRAARADDPATAPTHASGGAVAAPPVTQPPVSTSAPMLPSESLREEGRYFERGMLGAGGMGEVRLLHDRRIGRDVAEKTLAPDLSRDGDARKRFVREVRVQGQIEHPAVVPVYDCFVGADGELSFTMKRVQGRTLADVLTAITERDEATVARFSRRKLLSGFATVCLALDYAHSRGVVHRDLKPANLMFGDFGEVYVLDWGVAKVRGADDPIEGPGSSRPGETGIVGTPAYMAPEQITAGPEGVDARADVYALGLVLYEILAGRPMRFTRTPLRVLREIDEADPHPAHVNDDVPPELDAICAKAAAARPDDRFATARELSDAIERYLDGDRDLERRREQAKAHVARAVASLDGDRALSMQEIVRALALAPDDADAQKVLLELLVEAPDKLPPVAEAELAALHDLERRRTLRATLTGWLAMAIPMPFTAFLGNVKWAPALVAFAMMFAMAGFSWFLSRLPRVSRGLTTAYVSAVGLTMGAFSLWLGPFVLLPVAVATVTTLLGLALSRAERPFALAACTIGALLPVAGELTGLLPRSTIVETGRVVMLSRFADTPPFWTLLGLVWTSVAFAPLAGYVAGKMRDHLSDAERRLFAHAWHLKQIAPR